MTDFIEVKTADLVGVALDWAVAQAEKVEGLVIRRGKPAFEMEFDPEASAHEFCLKEYKCWLNYSPSTDWSQGGPLIEKHQVCTGWAGDKPLAFTRNTKYSDGVTVAPTLLVAACRAIVASVLGETVSVPKELLS